jgi:hypothetical protein
VGDLYLFGNDANIFAWRRPKDSIKPIGGKDGDNVLWSAEYTFSTKPPDPKKQRCQDTQVEDPLLEPPKINQGFNKFTVEATHDRFGRPILTSSHELIRGPQVEFDDGRDTINIEYNVATVDRALISSMKNTVNRFTLWGFPPRCVKLTSYTVENRYQGTCSLYYGLKLEFEINVILDKETGAYKSGWDRDLLDEGTKVLNGYWDPTDGTWQLSTIDGVDPDPNNPTHFIRFKDRNGENARVVLNGAGLPAQVVAGLGNYFVSLSSSNQGNPVSDGTKWLALDFELLDELTNPWTWDSDRTYRRGEIVTAAGNTAVAKRETINDAPVAADTDDWYYFASGLTDQGLYAAGTSYGKGAVVEDSANTTPGSIHVEKYNESNFLLLGIPSVLP